MLVLVLESPSLSGTSTIFGMVQIEDSVGSVIDDEDDVEGRGRCPHNNWFALKGCQISKRTNKANQELVVPLAFGQCNGRHYN